MSLEDYEFVDESSVTVRGYRHRTTIPCKIFQKMKLKDKDKLKWVLMKDGKVIVYKKTEEIEPCIQRKK